MARTIVNMACGLALLLLCGCETNLPFSQPDDEQININAVAVTGQELRVHVSRTLPISEGPNFYFLDYGSFCEEINKFYKSDMAIVNARVTLTVNGSQSVPMTYDADSLCYRCSYVPQAGDRLGLTVSAEGYETATASTVVPAQAMELSDMSYEVFYSQAATQEQRDFSHITTDYDEFGADSVMTIKFHFQDPPGERNYYRLVVRSVGEFKSILGQTLYTLCDVFTSADPVFHDSELTKGYGSWDAYFSNVFDDHIFDGQQYGITVNSRKRNEAVNYTIVELQSISPELYYYLKSMQQYRISTDDAFTTPIGIYGNVSNGWGVLGSVNKHTYIIRR